MISILWEKIILFHIFFQQLLIQYAGSQAQGSGCTATRQEVKGNVFPYMRFYTDLELNLLVLTQHGKCNHIQEV